jgi:rare lipoprotein A
MRLPIESLAGRARGLVLALILIPALAACGSHEQLASAGAGAAPLNGPAADYPVVIGAPYKVGDTLYTPADKMNVDEVGYTAADDAGGVTASHHTLPVPSYAEVTSLSTGRTILVRVERRGPMSGNEVIGLSPAALAQLGATVEDPVRVRRVNPPETDRAALRAGRTAPPRMDTPMSLLTVLKQKLPPQGSANLAPQKPSAPARLASVQVPPSSTAPSANPSVLAPSSAIRSQPRGTSSSPPPLPPLPSRESRVSSLPESAVVARAQTAPVVGARVEQAQPPAPVARVVQAQPALAATPAQPRESAREGAYMVQAATMSTLERAHNVAGSIGGSVSKAGPYFRVRTGPFATREEAEASLAKVRAAGYSDARIFTNG